MSVIGYSEKDFANYIANILASKKNYSVRSSDIFRPLTDELIPDFSKYYFSSDAHRRFFVKEMDLVNRALLSQELVKRLPVLIPSKEEKKQKLIEKLPNLRMHNREEGDLM